MKPNPILEEVWRVKDDLAKEAGNDLSRLCQNTRAWAEAHPHEGPSISSAAELRQSLRENDVLAHSALIMHESKEQS